MLLRDEVSSRYSWEVFGSGIAEQGVPESRMGSIAIELGQRFEPVHELATLPLDRIHRTHQSSTKLFMKFRPRCVFRGASRVSELTERAYFLSSIVSTSSRFEHCKSPRRLIQIRE